MADRPSLIRAAAAKIAVMHNHIEDLNFDDELAVNTDGWLDAAGVLVGRAGRSILGEVTTDTETEVINAMLHNLVYGKAGNFAEGAPNPTLEVIASTLFLMRRTYTELRSNQ